MARRRERPEKDAPKEEVIARNHAIDWSTVFHADVVADAGSPPPPDPANPAPSTPAMPPVSSGGAHDWSSVLRSDLAGASPAPVQAPAPAQASRVETVAPVGPPTSEPGETGADDGRTEPSWMSGMRSILAPLDPSAEQLFHENLDMESTPETPPLGVVPASPAPAPAAPTPSAPPVVDAPAEDPTRRAASAAASPEGRSSIFDELISAPDESGSVFDVPVEQLEGFGSVSEQAGNDLDLPIGFFNEPSADPIPEALTPTDGANDVDQAEEADGSGDEPLGPAGIFGGPGDWFDALLGAEASNDLNRRALAVDQTPDERQRPSRSFLEILGGEESASSDPDEASEEPQTPEPDAPDADRYGRLELRSPTDDVELLLISTELIGVFGAPPVRCEVNLCPPGTQLEVLKIHYDATVWSPDDAEIVWDYLSGWLPKIWTTLAGKRRIAGTVVETWVAYKDDKMPGEQHLRTTATLDDVLDFEIFSRIQRDAIEERTNGRWFDAVEVRRAD